MMMPTGGGPMGPGAGPMGPAGPGPMGPGGPGGGGGGGEIEMLIQLATQLLGRPPQSEEELMQVLQMLSAQQGGPAGAGPMGPGGPGPGGAAPENAAMMAAMAGGPRGGI